MKKHKDGQDMTEVLFKIEQQLSLLDKKIDTLIGQSPGKPFSAERPKSFQRFEHPQRILHKAICADCNKECEVPFRPSQDRPVYCKDCFSKRKGSGPFKGNLNNRSQEKRPFYAGHIEKPHDGGKKRFPGKKRPAVKRRKARA